MDNREWAEFANNLAGVLHRCPKDSVLILNAGDRFIDFTPGTGAGGIPVDEVDELREVTAAAGHRLSVWRSS
ncbi:hypothetical protein ACWIGI_11315 [Nocardia sp. NPDC055321]